MKVYKWRTVLDLSWLKPNTIKVSPEGMVQDERGIHEPTYRSTNGYLYEFVYTIDDLHILRPFDVLVAATFVPKPKDIPVGTPLKVRHINGKLDDCRAENLEWVEDVEIWRDITTHNIKPNYQVSNYGNIRSLLYESPLILNPLVCKGYYRTTLTRMNKKRGSFNIHRLVAEYFVINGHTPERFMVNHIDGNKLNNNWYNLEWVTHQGNVDHAVLTNLICYGDSNGMSKISEKEAVVVCECLNKHRGCVNDAFNELKQIIPDITYPIVSSIKYGKTFAYISKKILTDDGKTTLERHTDYDTIIEAAKCLKENNGNVKLTKKMLNEKYPWITCAWLWHLKDKSVASEITDEIFQKNEFPITTKFLTETDALKIIKCLLKYKGDKFATYKTYLELKTEIPDLCIGKIRSIKDKRAWTELSDKYF